MNKTAAAALVACAFFSIAANGATAADWQKLAASVTSNIAAKLEKAIDAHTSKVRELATPENYALLKSSKLKDAAAKLALQKKLAEAALEDEQKTETGRFKWHGRYVQQAIDMEKGTATFTHADGYSLTVNFTRPNLEAEAKAANAKLPPPAMTNGVPRALAEARLRRRAEKINPVVDFVESVNATKGERPPR